MSRFTTPLLPPNFLYDSIKVVQVLEDFPDPVGDEITLEDNTIYFIDNPKLDITGYTLVFNQRSQINGFGQNVSGISSSTNGVSVADRLRGRAAGDDGAVHLCRV